MLLELPNQSANILKTVQFSISPIFFHIQSNSDQKISTIAPNLMKYSCDNISYPREDTKTLLYLIRHGEIQSNVEMKLSGWEVDEDLTSNGKKEAIQLAKKIGELQKNKTTHISSLYSSPLKRAVTTAEIISQELKIPLTIREDLKEIKWGQASLKTYEECKSTWGQEEKRIISEFPKPDLNILWNILPIIPDAEKYNALLERTVKEIQKISRETPGKEIALISHGSVIRTLVSKCVDSMDEEIVPKIKNCSIAVFSYMENSDNSSSHLEFLGVAS